MSAEGKMLWRSRRGMLELDLFLSDFIALHYFKLTVEQVEAFEVLLNFDDQELWNLFIKDFNAPEDLLRFLASKF